MNDHPRGTDAAAHRATAIAFVGLGALYIAPQLWSVYQAIRSGLSVGDAWSYYWFGPSPFWWFAVALFTFGAVNLGVARYGRGQGLPPAGP